MKSPRVLLHQAAYQTMEREGIEHYPNECCGILLGTGESIRQAYPVRNLEEERQNDRFVLDPKGYLSAEEEALRANLRIVGFYHTHPDHPAYPSATDRLYAWEDYWYIILGIRQKRVQECNLFQLDGEEFVLRSFEQVE